MGRRDAEIITVSIKEVDKWESNPKSIKKPDYARLKSQITQLGNYKSLICCREGARYICLGGNSRLRALRELG